ncbi:MAG: hypothetical protein ACJAR2_002197 [Ilumatobacter sp.]|jgi:hypothetical protein
MSGRYPEYQRCADSSTGLGAAQASWMIIMVRVASIRAAVANAVTGAITIGSELHRLVNARGGLSWQRGASPTMSAI